ncbi:MAG: hypothetical protein ABT01_06770 [Clostridium sp. SCN 57-10]|nr:MAG: hypothetical protein ABT01_06770 [Clostridium sp. SCN 57-10]
MTKYIETKADTIDAAVEKALAELGCSRDEVSVEVLEQPKTGFLGIGSKPALVRVEYVSSPAGVARDFIEGLLVRFGVSAQMEVREDPAEKVIRVDLSGDNMGVIIGRRGDTLDAIQYLATIVTNREEDERWRVVVDTEGYRAKREAALCALAEKTAQKALKYKKPVALDPMNPHERRIVHSALQEFAGVTTYSTGTEPNRRVIVSPEGAKPVGANFSTQGQGNRSGANRGGSRGGPRGGNRKPQQVQ